MAPYRRSATASNRFTVSPGTSGLPIGATTTLQINVRLDGTLHAEAISWPGEGSAYADWKAALSIHDYSIGSPEVASFVARGDLYAYNVSPYWGHSYCGIWRDFWQTASNISPPDPYSASGEQIETAESFHFRTDHAIDTGMLTLELDAIIGHTLDLDASLDVYAYANHDATAGADFYNSLSFGVTPQTPGVQLDWEVDPTPVPLPGAAILLGSGLISLVGLKRKKS